MGRRAGRDQRNFEQQAKRESVLNFRRRTITESHRAILKKERQNDVNLLREKREENLPIPVTMKMAARENFFFFFSSYSHPKWREISDVGEFVQNCSFIIYLLPHFRYTILLDLQYIPVVSVFF